MLESTRLVPISIRYGVISRRRNRQGSLFGRRLLIGSHSSDDSRIAACADCPIQLATVVRGRGGFVVRKMSLFIDSSVEIQRLRYEAARARRLSSAISDEAAVRRLKQYATEMEEATARLERQAADEQRGCSPNAGKEST